MFHSTTTKNSDLFGSLAAISLTWKAHSFASLAFAKFALVVVSLQLFKKQNTDKQLYLILLVDENFVNILYNLQVHQNFMLEYLPLVISLN